MIIYDGDLPVTDEWIRKHVGKNVSLRFPARLDDLIEAEGIEGMNDLCDTTTGVVLYDLTYHVARPERDADLGENVLLIEARGSVAP